MGRDFLGRRGWGAASGWAGCGCLLQAIFIVWTSEAVPSPPFLPAIGSQPSGSSPGSEEHDLGGYARLVLGLDTVDCLGRKTVAVGLKKWSAQNCNASHWPRIHCMHPTERTNGYDRTQRQRGRKCQPWSSNASRICGLGDITKAQGVYVVCARDRLTTVQMVMQLKPLGCYRTPARCYSEVP